MRGVLVIKKVKLISSGGDILDALFVRYRERSVIYEIATVYGFLPNNLPDHMEIDDFTAVVLGYPSARMLAMEMASMSDHEVLKKVREIAEQGLMYSKFGN